MGARRWKTAGVVGGLLLAWLLAAPVTRAEQLPLTAYTRADGLASDNVRRIVRDSRGFLWVCANLGLSRFDGSHFKTYGVAHGLPPFSVTDLVETPDGLYWMASNSDGVYRFDPRGAPAVFTHYPVGDDPAARRINALYQDRAGRLWAGTDGGLFLLDEGTSLGRFIPVALGLPGQPDRLARVWAFVEDDEGSPWIGTKFGLVRRLPDGRMLHHPVRPARDIDAVLTLLRDREGRLWLGHQASGVIVVKPQPIATVAAGETALWRRLARAGALPAAPGEAALFTTAEGLSHNFVLTICQTSDGRVWAGTYGGLAEFIGGGFRTYTTAHGLSSNIIRHLVEDRDGGLWVGTQTSGALRLARSGFVTYRVADGLGHDLVRGVFETPAGELCAVTEDGYLNRLDGGRFTAVRVNLPRVGPESPRLLNMLRDRAGEWWAATTQGLCRFPPVDRLEQLAQTRPRACYTTADGLAHNDSRRLYEDARGDIWIGAFAPGRSALTRWERATGKFHRYSDADGLPPFRAVYAFREDTAGNLWIGFRDGPLARYAAGRFTIFSVDDGVPAGNLNDLYLDGAGRLWVAAVGGLARVDDPAAARPRFVLYARPEGFPNTYTNSLAEDADGNLYVGTLQGVSRLNPTTGHQRHYSAADGVALPTPAAACRDRRGALWFGTDRGLSRLLPRPDPPQSPPTVFISGLRVAGLPRPVRELGEAAIAGLEFAPGQNNLRIEFFGLSAAGEGPLRYEYKIEGRDERWSASTEQRSVDLSFAPGAYRFLVRAVSAEGAVSSAPAVVGFRILPPIWQRWWFLALAAALVGMAVYALYRYRVARLLELERVRTRIATDLHDDIGSSLSQVAVLSEVIRRRVGANPVVEGPLAMIARLSRDLVDAMSDIAWAINPRRDHLSDLTHRMRRFASDARTASDIDLFFRAPDERDDIHMGADMRREVFLIFKEGVNNIARHSGCTEADVEFAVRRGWVELRLHDNGKGFDPAPASEGNGLASMQQRAARLGGTLEVASGNGQGTTLRLRAPLGGRGRARRAAQG